jgi:hypothetical protein
MVPNFHSPQLESMAAMLGFSKVEDMIIVQQQQMIQMMTASAANPSLFYASGSTTKAGGVGKFNKGLKPSIVQPGDSVTALNPSSIVGIPTIPTVHFSGQGNFKNKTFINSDPSAASAPAPPPVPTTTTTTAASSIALATQIPTPALTQSVANFQAATWYTGRGRDGRDGNRGGSRGGRGRLNNWFAGRNVYSRHPSANINVDAEENHTESSLAAPSSAPVTTTTIAAAADRAAKAKNELNPYADMIADIAAEDKAAAAAGIVIRGGRGRGFRGRTSYFRGGGRGRGPLIENKKWVREAEVTTPLTAGR